MATNGHPTTNGRSTADAASIASPFPPIGELPYLLTLPGHGFYWFQIILPDTERHT